MCNFFSCLWSHLTACDFWIGAATALVLLLILEAVLILWLKHRKCVKAITLQDNGGDFSISGRAFRDFLSGIVQQVGGATLRTVGLYRQNDGFRAELFLKLQPKADLVAIHEKLRPAILQAVKDRLGLGDKLAAVNLRFESLPPAENDESPNA